MTIRADAPLWDEQERREQLARDVVGLDEVQAWAWRMCEDYDGMGLQYDGLVKLGRVIVARGLLIAAEHGLLEQQAPSGELAGREVE